MFSLMFTRSSQRSGGLACHRAQEPWPPQKTVDEADGMSAPRRGRQKVRSVREERARAEGGARRTAVLPALPRRRQGGRGLDVENLQHIWRLTDNHRHAPGGCLDLRDVAGRSGSSGACEWTEGACPRANARGRPRRPALAIPPQLPFRGYARMRWFAGRSSSAKNGTSYRSPKGKLRQLKSRHLGEPGSPPTTHQEPRVEIQLVTDRGRFKRPEAKSPGRAPGGPTQRKKAGMAARPFPPDRMERTRAAR